MTTNRIPEKYAQNIRKFHLFQRVSTEKTFVDCIIYDQCFKMFHQLRELFVCLCCILGICLILSMVYKWIPVEIIVQHVDTTEKPNIRQIQHRFGKLHLKSVNKSKGCRPHQDIVLLKTHKTGGSTLQNIFYRFGERRNLTFALPSKENYFGSPELFSRSSVMKLDKAKKYNILANHARYNKEGFQKLMPADTVYVTSVRHPASQFESMYKYYKLSNRFGVNIRQFAKRPLQYFLKSKSESKTLRQSSVNPMLFDLGLKKKYLRDPNRIKRKIREIDNKFKLVLIMEHFDESLILLKDLLCWELIDIAYFTINARIDDEVEEISQETKDNLTAWNEGDMLLYSHFNKTLWKRIEAFGFERMKSELEIFHEVLEELKKICSIGNKQIHGGKTKIVKYKLKNMPSSEDNYFCKSLTRKPQEYLEILKQKMKRMFKM